MYRGPRDERESTKPYDVSLAEQNRLNLEIPGKTTNMTTNYNIKGGEARMKKMQRLGG